MVCASNAYGSKWITYGLKWNYDNNHSCIDMTVVCTSNAYGLKWNNDSGHSYIDMTVVCTSNAYGSKCIMYASK